MSELLEGVSPPPSLSACILTTGDEVRLDACLRSIEGVVDEIVVQVDARQPGAAAQVAARFTDRVVVETPPLFECEPPRIDFASARNRGLDLATGDWVLVIDADEQLSDGAFLREAVAHAAWGKMDGVGVRVECVTDRGLAEAATSIRAFRRCDRIRWRYPVHNQLVGVRNALSSGAVIRSSYEGAGALDARVARAVPALRAMYALAEPEAPERAHAAFYLCRSYAAVHDHWRTIEWGRRCAELCGDHSSVAPFWLWLAEAELHTSGPDAAGAVVDEGLARHPDLADLWHMRMGLDLMRWTDAASRTLAGASPFGTVPQRSLPHAARALDAARLLGLPISTNLGAPLPGSPSAHNPDDQAPVA